MPVRFVETLEEANVVTHGGGSFHGDDIFGLVFLDQLLDGKVSCYRIPFNETSKLNETKGKIVFDTGGGKFDHHQKGGNGVHELINQERTAIPCASFGLLWNYYGREFIKKNYFGYEEEFYESVFRYVDFHLVRSIDAADNGLFPISLEGYPVYRVLSLSCIISFLNQEEPAKDSENKGLQLAIKFAKKAFNITLQRAVNAYKMKKSFFDIDNRKNKNDKYEKIVYSALKAEMDSKDNRLNDYKKAFDVDKNYNTFDKSKISSLWSERGEAYLNSIDQMHCSYMVSHITAIINGFAADSLGLGCRINPCLDYMDFPTLGSIFADPEEYGERYEKDLKELFDEILRNAVKVALFKAQSKEYVEDKVKSTLGHILVFERKVYWQDWIANMPEAKKIWFVISPTDNGAWKVKPIPCKYNANGYKKGFPSKWFGYSKDNKEGYGKFNKGVEFIHASGFLAICDTLNSAQELAKQALFNQENKPIEIEK